MEKTLFQKIIDREIPATIEYEDDKVIAIRDIQPSAKLHVLVIPKKPIPTVNDLTEADAPLVGHVYQVAKQLAERFNVSESGYRLVTNVNKDAGQTVFHLHFHVLGGQPLGRMNTHGGSHSRSAGPGILRDAGIMVLAAIGLAIVFNSMNPKAITWLKKDFEHTEASNADLEKYLAGEPADEPVASTEPEVAVESQPEEPAAEAPKKDVVKEAEPTKDVEPTKHVIKQIPSGTTAEPSVPDFSPEPGLIREITYSAFKAFLKKPHYLIDARRPEAYAEGYIADAKNIYGGEVQGNIPMILEMVPRDRVILIYCDGGDECELSHHVADVLKQFEYGPMFIYKGGWNEWILKNK